ncbi:tRNA (5-methylaminomethyl-2-thiouridine)(34)-methyltransferase MnmD [Tamlana sp. 62-3]|uniref:tRNA (5-methylaminomethyl-2-thiouridine)(34)-methyltransferase MnmD n=1 Tax=Neotamlana sargassicola TaxID=2883125 RepID=A0A9X1I8R1_9FLAO|nr:tRNA (5-methylaminomethyl-2-thiouridine)(34)-methyltransferase MnmD [Tamlana sargassicola]MCB4809428.1 tRNA (5-methylaminomethyl-2-thiouridine)(34)-methyltransferase MnmD [Tamlana sargassicola]
MKREIIITADGSTTIHIPEWNEQYHSKHGAIKEAYHVFIKQGLKYFHDKYWHSERVSESHDIDVIQSAAEFYLKEDGVTPSAVEEHKKINNSVSILEIGFGTGLNAFITLFEAEKLNLKIDYFGVEGYPVAVNEVEKLNYAKEIQQSEEIFREIHKVSWEEKHNITPYFSLVKQEKFFDAIEDENAFNIIYFDAFGARVQPELWTETIFQKMYKALKNNGVLVTYAAKGSVRRAMQAVGFLVEKLPGPPGKREMLRATKHSRRIP